MELSVGQVAGIINAILLLVQISLPLLHSLILVAVLDSRNPVITWSSVSRFLNSTYLPTLLGSDTVAGRRHGVSTRVVSISYLSIISTIILAGARILSPIGLGEGIRQGRRVNATFRYANDPSPFSLATMDRGEYGLGRACDNGYRPCPGVNATPIANRSLEFLPVLPEEDLPPELPPDILSQVVLNLTPYLQPPFSPDDVTDVLQTFFSLTPFYDLTNERTEFLVYDNSIPQSTLDFFQNGVNKSNDLLSNPFEIQFRSYSNSPHIGDMSKMNTTAIDLYVQQLVLDTGYIVREGIIVDLDHGGVGFRNHTVPISTSAASMWSEELLWLVPLTSCIGTNWTIYSHPQLTPGQNTGPQFVVSDFKLVYENHNNSSPDPHGDFGFDTRLQKAAKSFDFEIRKYGNLTDSPREAEINSSVFSDNRSLDVIFFNSGDELQILQFQDSEVGIETSGGENNSLSLSSPLLSCHKMNSSSQPSATNLLVQCGYLIPLPVPASRGDHIDPAGTMRRQPISICGTGIEARINLVDFVFNGTGHEGDLSRLRVTNVRKKEYADDSALPLWAVENPGPGWNIGEISLLWGLVSDQSSLGSNSSTQFDTFRREYFPLPASVEAGFSGSGFGDSMGATRGLTLALALAYGQDFTVDSFMTSRKWQHLTTSAETFSLIPNLLWTDYAANLLTGTNSRLDTGAVIGEVVLLERYITYQYRFGILAFAACGLWLVLVILCISLTLLPDSRARLTPYNMRLLLNKLSPGRYMALVGDLDGKLLRMSTKDWIRTAGHEPVEISGNGERRHIMSVDEDTSS